MERSVIDISANLTLIQSIGYVMFDCDEKITEDLKSFCQNMIQQKFEDCVPYNKRFLENLPPSYQITDESLVQKIETYLNVLMPHYWKVWGEGHKNYQKIKISENDVWALFQKSGEYVSLHNHTKRFSFVIWLELPYNNENETYPNNFTNNNEPPGSFMFVVPSFNIKGGILKHSIRLNKNFEGKMIIWPSHINHQVTPFYADDDRYRISVSGNFEFESEFYN